MVRKETLSKFKCSYCGHETIKKAQVPRYTTTSLRECAPPYWRQYGYCYECGMTPRPQDIKAYNFDNWSKRMTLEEGGNV